MQVKKTRPFKKSWAQRFNPSEIEDVIEQTEPLSDKGGSIFDLPDLIYTMEPNQRLEINGNRKLIPVFGESYSSDTHPAYFMRDGPTLHLKAMTKNELLVRGNPQHLIWDALWNYQHGKFHSVIGYSWMPYSGRRSRAIVPTVYQKLGWDIAAALTFDGVDVKILNPREKPSVEIPSDYDASIPSRRQDAEYAVRFSNLPTDPEQAYAQWHLLSHVTISKQGMFAGMGQGTLVEPVVFIPATIAAYLLRGMADSNAAVERTGKPEQVLEEIIVNPFPSLSDEMLDLFRNTQRVFKVTEYRARGKMEKQYERLNQGEQQALASVFMHQIGPDAFDYSKNGRFDRTFVRAAFDRILQ